MHGGSRPREHPSRSFGRLMPQRQWHVFHLMRLLQSMTLVSARYWPIKSLPFTASDVVQCLTVQLEGAQQTLQGALPSGCVWSPHHMAAGIGVCRGQIYVSECPGAYRTAYALYLALLQGDLHDQAVVFMPDASFNFSDRVNCQQLITTNAAPDEELYNWEELS
jgi:hypothetical protein